uniref:Uncharacterized protein n=1 Tax=Setaria italica TaxID=4555 RepID=K3ZGF2_SETIT
MTIILGHSSPFTSFSSKEKRNTILIASTVKDGGMWNYSSSLGALEWYVVMILYFY